MNYGQLLELIVVLSLVLGMCSTFWECPANQQQNLLIWMIAVHCLGFREDVTSARKFSLALWAQVEKWKLLSHVWLTLCNPMDYTVHGILQARILEWVAIPFSGDLPNPGIEPRSPILHMDSLPSEPRGKPENTGVGSQSLLQQIFPTQ